MPSATVPRLLPAVRHRALSALFDPRSMKQKTWLDVEVAALHDPFLHRAVTVVKQGLATREEALIAVALALSESNSRLLDEKKTRLMNAPASPIVLKSKQF
jgi:hypothetical protein